MLAREFATLMNHTGGYAIIRHFPGNSCYDSRTWGVVSEISKIAPKMKVLEMQTTNLDMIETEKVVAGWLTRYGKELQGIVSADDSGAQLGINKACENAGRNDIIRIAAGNSKVGMEAIQNGQLHAITYQSAEADGAVPMYLAAKWFSGEKIPEVQYLPKRIITKDNVLDYLPPQW
jgi:ABC-type sugar transport system substrate-binding protein